jgi:hypothetical protein
MEYKNICTKCNKSFKTRQNLQKHLSSPSACIIVTKFQCNNCNEYLKNKKSLDDHKKTCKKKIVDSSSEISKDDSDDDIDSDISSDLDSDSDSEIKKEVKKDKQKTETDTEYLDSDNEIKKEVEEVVEEAVEEVKEKVVEDVVEKKVEMKIVDEKKNEAKVIDMKVKKVEEKEVDKEQRTQTQNFIDIFNKSLDIVKDKKLEIDNYFNEKKKELDEKINEQMNAKAKLDDAKVKLEGAKEGLKDIIVNQINKKMESFYDGLDLKIDEKTKERYDQNIELRVAKKMIKYVEKKMNEPLEESIHKKYEELTEENKKILDSHLKKKLKETISMINKAIEIKIEEEEQKANSELIKLLGMNFSPTVTSNILINKYGIKNPINDLLEILQNTSISNNEKISLFYDNSNSVDVRFFKKVITCFEIVNNKKEYKNNNYLELFNRSLIDNIYYGLTGIQNYIEVGKLDKRIVNKQLFSNDTGEIVTESHDDLHHTDVDRFSSKNRSEVISKVVKDEEMVVKDEEMVKEEEVVKEEDEDNKLDEIINAMNNKKDIFINLDVSNKKDVEKEEIQNEEIQKEEIQKEEIEKVEIIEMEVKEVDKKSNFDNIEIGKKTMYYYNNMSIWDNEKSTEKIIFEYFLKEENIPDNYFAFPWNSLMNSSDDNIENVLKEMNEIIGENKNSCFTVMQNIDAVNIKYLQLAKDINITHIFVSHLSELARINGEELGLILIPFSICVKDDILGGSEINNIINRQYLVNYVGNKNKNIREKIFNEFKGFSEECYIKKSEEKEYNFEIMNNSKFTLCPAGNGINSIRLWEAMSTGSIPVILSNTLLLPMIGEFNWTDCVVIGNEKDIKGLYAELKEIDDEKLEMMSNNCIKYYNKYFSNESIQNVIFNYYGV